MNSPNDLPNEIQIVVEINPPPEIIVEVSDEPSEEVVEVQVEGLQGPSSADRPLETDPTDLYLTAKKLALGA